MTECQQTPTQNVLEHGKSVNQYFKDLHDHIINGDTLEFEWKLPEWISSSFLWEKLHPISIVDEYQVYHDCGKPFCCIVDENGKHHFPNHAEVSKNVWTHLQGNPEVANLIEKDMKIHLMKACECEEFSKDKDAATLLITALCEIHSNAAMFGGIDSTSFKIKWKQVNQRGKKIIENLTKGEKNE